MGNLPFEFCFVFSELIISCFKNISQIVDNNQYATSNLNTSSSYQALNQTQMSSSSSDEEVSVSPVNTTVIQDSYMNNNFSLFQVINPLDINRNYTSNNINILHSTNETKSDKTNTKQSNLLAYSHQQIKRSKYSHTSSPNSLQIKQENLFNSDGESTGSNESNDSNSSFSSSNNTNTTNNTNNNCSTEYSKQLIKIEPYQLKNLTNSNDLDNSNNHLQQQPQIISMNSSTPINVIKINNPKENKNSPTSLNNLISSSNCLKLPITTTKINTATTSEVNSNHKTIIQYKQLLTNNPIKLQQPQQQTSIANTNTNKTNLQLTNDSLITSSRNDVIKVIIRQIIKKLIIKFKKKNLNKQTLYNEFIK